jgi:post-segregation antitoxin (ccd killing protein)
MEIETNRQSMNYNNGKIYSIRSHQTDDVYVGSTTQPLSKRLSKHRQEFNRWKNENKNKKYYSSFEILKYDDAYIELIEAYPCNSKEELEKREGEIIRATENCVNKNIAGRTQKQYRADNKEIIAERMKQYREDNKEALAEQMKQYRDDNKETIAVQTKQYRADNKEIIAEKSKQYYENNNDAIFR